MYGSSPPSLQMQPLCVSAYTLACAAGIGLAALQQSLQQRCTGLRANDLDHCSLDTYIGRVSGVEDLRLPDALSSWDCRNNRLAWLGLNQDGFMAQAQALVQRHGRGRVALVLGTSTASIASTEEVYRLWHSAMELPAQLRNQKIHSPNSLTGFVADVFGLTGPQLTVATACSSSARVFGSAARLLRAGWADAAIVGGVDSLCLSVLYGFNALELMSMDLCRPFDIHRSGLNIGEAAGFAILERDVNADLSFVGYGESSDAFHMSSPHPQGIGAQQAMQQALQRAHLSPDDIDYINLHGTATRMNDEVEARAITRIFARPLPCSSTKAWTGHTLGAAGIVEAVITLLSLERGLIPGNLFCDQPEPGIQDYLQLQNAACSLQHAMSNSFGFGGNNCSLIFARTAH